VERSKDLFGEWPLWSRLVTSRLVVHVVTTNWKEGLLTFLGAALGVGFVVLVLPKIVPPVTKTVKEHIHAMNMLAEHRAERAREELRRVRAECQQGNNAACVEYADMLRKE
jgi:hypothetical protein